MIKILLTQDKFTLIDNKDFDIISKYKWYAHRRRKNYYAETTKKQKHILMHRLIMNIINPEIQIDHIDGNGLNNQRHNLRICTHQENHFNKKSRKNSSSKFKGVSWHSSHKKWRCVIGINTKHIHLGYFDNEKEAAYVYDIAAKQYFGEFANLNFNNEDDYNNENT